MINQQAAVKAITRNVMRQLKASPGTYRTIAALMNDVGMRAGMLATSIGEYANRPELQHYPRIRNGVTELRTAAQLLDQGADDLLGRAFGESDPAAAIRRLGSAVLAMRRVWRTFNMAAQTKMPDIGLNYAAIPGKVDQIVMQAAQLGPMITRAATAGR